MKQRICIYCNTLKPEGNFSLEHIFPESLGGKLLNELFKTRSVCRSCNSLMGLYVDGAYIKSYFVQAPLAIESLRYVDLAASTACPLIYIGKLDGITLPIDSICELWLSPCRGRILHIHSNHDEDFYSYTGGDPRAAKKTPGLAIFINATDKQSWMLLGLRSFVKHFKKSKRVVANISFSAEDNYKKIGRKPDASEQEIINSFTNVHGDSIKCSLSTDMTYCERFIAKIALALGYQLAGTEYLSTGYAVNLRNFLWEKNASIRDEIGMLFKNIWKHEKGDLEEFFKWEGGIIIALIITVDLLVLHVTIYGNNHSIVISPDHTVIRKCICKIGDGVVFVLIPQLGECVGPIPIFDYVAHKTQLSVIQKLRELESKRTSAEDLVKTR